MENLYHYLWKTKIKGSNLKDVDGRDIEIIDPGLHNNDSGPDFFNAKLKIDGVVWIGNVEIHIKASDWFRHHHDDDPAYDNVILHVVAVSDKRIAKSDGSLLPQVLFTFPENFFRTVAALAEETDTVKCSSMLRTLPRLNVEDWLESLSVERLRQKAQKVLSIRDTTDGDWQQTCFILLARGFGFGLNADPFEMTAKSVPLKILYHHSDNLLQLEALLFGQAGMLDPTLHIFDEYYQALCREYYFLARKYGLRPLNPGLWKYTRTRPQNFPHRRIAFLASAALGGFSLFSKIIGSDKNLDSLMEVFDMKAEGYWKNHYSFDTEDREPPQQFSYSSKILLIINVAIPLLYAYAAATGNIEKGEIALNLLADLPAENNIIIRQWKSLGIEAKDASRSQALIHLRKEYCDKAKCMYCRFGHKFLRRAVDQQPSLV